MNIIIVNAYGRSNRGDAVLLDECLAEISSTYPNAKIACSIFEETTQAKSKYPNISWSERIGNTKTSGIIAKFVTFFRVFVAAIATIPFFGFLVNLLPEGQRRTWEAIRTSRFVVSAPGGYIHDTNFAYFVSILHIWLGTRAGSTVILAPQSIGPISKRPARWLVRKALSSASAICARESYSYTFLTQDLNLPASKIISVGDSAFWNNNVSADNLMLKSVRREIGLNFVDQKRILGVTVVDWSFPKSSNPDFASSRYVNAMAKVLDHMAEKHGLQPVIFNQVSDDLIIARRLAAAAKTKVLIDDQSREPEVLRALMAECTLFLGTRFHSCIFAMMAGTPTFAIAYLPKTEFILRDLELDHRCVEIDALDPTYVIQTLESDLEDIAASRAAVTMAVSKYQREHVRLCDVLNNYT